VDSRYNATTTLVEERIVLIRARSFEDAAARAKREARRYVRGMTYQNCYGERVRQRYLGRCEVFELFDNPDAGVEVFSSTRLVPRKVTDRTVIDRVIGAKESDREAQTRWRFLNDAITRELSDRSTYNNRLQRTG
jgi:hypothetical protein